MHVCLQQCASSGFRRLEFIARSLTPLSLFVNIISCELHQTNLLIVKVNAMDFYVYLRYNDKVNKNKEHSCIILRK